MGGNDRGTQYRSAIYPTTEDQMTLALKSREAYEAALMQAKRKGPITCEIRHAAEFDTCFYYAEDYHQQYLAKPMARPYCSAQPLEVPLPAFDSWAPAELSPLAPK